MWKFKKSEKKTDYELQPVMIWAKITELTDRYMIYNAVKNERYWRLKNGLRQSRIGSDTKFRLYSKHKPSAKM